MDGCLLSLWVSASQERGLESRSFPSGAYLNQLPGAGVSLTSYQCTCDQEKNQVTANYEDFKNRHIAGKNAQGSDEFCSEQIKNRKITVKRRCKPRNTFIFADEDDVKAVCGEQGVNIPNTNLYKSKKQFKIVDCKNADQNRRPPNCTYKAQNANRLMYIIVACDNNKLPVHFERSEPNPTQFGITGRV
ncbi:hypothetical protein HHUSO_G36055 [Huso huso]|uniref:Ribonuclease A-domain domain-containing protein n=1 Tax=Huso huso TaxID=61971 RepID=A0ABR0Y1Q2_HUSHU